jgi:hypothetical protein
MRLNETQRLLSSKAEPLGDLSRLMRRLNIDGPLLGGLLLICGFGLVVLYSAVGENMRLWLSQIVRLGVALFSMLVTVGLRGRTRATRAGTDHRRSWPGRAALARPGYPLPAIRNHEAGRADDGRLVPA